jgi:hypothetical protein
LRFLRAILAFYVPAWFNVVVPGHTRGVITMPGANEQSCHASSCCSSDSSDSSDKKPSPDERRRCAVCYVAASYTFPVVHIFHLAPSELLTVSNVTAHAQVESIDFPAPYWPVGPPSLL